MSDYSAARREGRLADPERDLRSDPRMNPKLLAQLAAFGLDGPAAAPEFGFAAASVGTPTRPIIIAARNVRIEPQRGAG